MNFIQSPIDTGVAAVYFQKKIAWEELPAKVEIQASAIGVYNLMIDGKRSEIKC